MLSGVWLEDGEMNEPQLWVLSTRGHLIYHFECMGYDSCIVCVL